MKKSIPGFYFDKEKNRYFRIQPNQSTVSSSAHHSVQAVKERQQSSKKRKLDEVKVSRRRAQTITRCRQLQHPGLGGNLSIVFGASSPVRRLEARSNVVTSALRPPKEAITSITNASISKVLHDRSSDQLFTLQTQWPNVGADSEPISTISSYKRSAPCSRFATHGLPLQGSLFQGTAVSLETCRVTDDLRVMIVICSKPHGGCVYLRQMPDPHNAEPLSYLGMEVQFLVGAITPWSASVSKVSAEFMVASSQGLYRMYAAEESWTMELLGQRGYQPQRTDREDFLNVDWQDRNLISAGDRSGRVIFVDTRSQEWVTRLKLKSTISAIRKINEHQLVVRSFDAMNIYDLRYAKRPHLKGNATRPWLSFSQYKSPLKPTGNFDYDATLGLIATTTDQPNKVMIYSTRTGRAAPTRLNNYTFGNDLNDIKFASSRTEPTSLLLAHGDTVEEWAYG